MWKITNICIRRYAGNQKKKSDPKGAVEMSKVPKSSASKGIHEWFGHEKREPKLSKLRTSWNFLVCNEHLQIVCAFSLPRSISHTMSFPITYVHMSKCPKWWVNLRTRVRQTSHGFSHGIPVGKRKVLLYFIIYVFKFDFNFMFNF